MTAIETMLAEHQCERLIKRFAVLNDENAYEEMVGMFAENGRFARPSQPEDIITGREAILAAFKARPLRVSRHFISNILVQLQDDNHASAISYVLLYTAANGSNEATPPYLIGRFKDRLEQIDGQWLFTERLGSVDLKAQ
jgi:hypothetical protein